MIFHTLGGVTHTRGHIQAHPLPEPNRGFQVSYENGPARTTFNLIAPPARGEEEPLAIESFAIEPTHYVELMARVDALLRGA
jgi:hypothetical protein